MQEQNEWFRRNWIWAIPGCGCLSIIILMVFGVGATYFGITNFFKSSSPYENAVAQAKHNSKLINELGDSIETVGMMNGSVSIQNDSGSAIFNISLEGSKGKGMLYVVAERFDGEWVYEDLYVIIRESQERINLLNQTVEGI